EPERFYTQDAAPFWALFSRRRKIFRFHSAQPPVELVRCPALPLVAAARSSARRMARHLFNDSFRNQEKLSAVLAAEGVSAAGKRRQPRATWGHSRAPSGNGP